MRVRLCLVLIAILMLVPDGGKPIHITVRPLVSLYGTPVAITCRAEPEKGNRWMVIGIEGAERQIVQLDEEHSRTETRKFHPICGGQQAFCVLVQTGNRETRVTQAFEVACSAF